MKELRELKEQLDDALLQTGHVTSEDFLFNPSFAHFGGSHYVFTLRKVSAESLRRTQIIFEVEISGDYELGGINNFQELSHIKGYAVRDLKFGIAGDQVFATWNTGHTTNAKLANQVLVSSYPDLSDVSIVDWSRRSRIEKNWGFFEEHQNLCCVYSLRPLLLLFSSDKMGDEKVRFHAFSRKRGLGIFRRSISIGSQPVRIRDKLVFTGHLKPQFFKLRMYIPLLVSLNLKTSDSTLQFLRFPQKGLSFRWSRFNPFAFAVNYASGFAPFRKGYLMGVGIADEDYKLFYLRKDLEVFGDATNP